jgi:hypothetical protein
VCSPTLTWATERWAEAQAMHRLHGEGARAHIEERIRDLEAKNALAGVEQWREIASHLDAINSPNASA